MVGADPDPNIRFQLERDPPWNIAVIYCDNSQSAQSPAPRRALFLRGRRRPCIVDRDKPGDDRLMCAGMLPETLMHPVLRLYEDVLSSAENRRIPAAAAAALHLRGARHGHDRRRDGERRRSLAGRRRRAGQAGPGGVTCWRWELSRGDQGSTVASAPGMMTHEKLTAYLETMPKGELLMRGDSVAFPPGGCAYLHRHQGPASAA